MAKRLVSNLLYKELSYALHGAAIEVRKDFGPGHKEKLYQDAFAAELKRRKIPFEKEKAIKVYSPKDGRFIGSYRPDFIVDGKIIVEMKAEKFVSRNEIKRMYDYLRNGDYELSYFINFASPRLFVRRIIYTNDRKPFRISPKDTGTKLINTKNLLVSIGLILVLFSGLTVHAGTSLTVTPAVIDEKAKARDILKEAVTLVNNTNRKLNAYTFVNSISIVEGKQEFLDPSRADHASSLANWIEISRAVIELLPQEKKRIDFLIAVNLRAKPGIYHALISFGEGTTRDEAEAYLNDAPSVAVNLEVLEDIKERLQLKKFIPDKVFFFGFPVSFSYEFENAGNRPVTPFGEIRIYNRRGEEVATVDVNDEGSPVEVDGVKKFASTWRPIKNDETKYLAGLLGASGSFGKYKAFLDLEYGLHQRSTIQDTVYFWVAPLPQILIIFLTFLAGILLITYIVHRRSGGEKSGLTGINTRIVADRPNILDLRRNTKDH